MVIRLAPQLKLNQIKLEDVGVCEPVCYLSEERSELVELDIFFPHISKTHVGEVRTRSRISPSCRDALELWPSRTSLTGIVGRELRFVCPVCCCHLSDEKHFASPRPPFEMLNFARFCIVEFDTIMFLHLGNMTFLRIWKSSAFRKLRCLRRGLSLSWAWDKMLTLVAGRENY